MVAVAVLLVACSDGTMSDTRPLVRDSAGVRIVETDPEVWRWVVLDPDGALVGSVEVPGDLEVLEIGDDYLLGVAIDALGVEYIRVHRLNRGSAEENSP